ncbi:helix-turn-helix domain-containing protein [Gordonia insulae]|uniref:Helix-turn-helix domain-containing protein n=1 Tax=Gordonia insulae TaxID=2420509 RepID=A0A3G8JSW7_9ACTN|nr:helix-turn-helix domain-containing protein [Gordonia insulae]AZG48028.1 hypothetical protein D7316_04641 [Gordonia insulae]
MHDEQNPTDTAQDDAAGADLAGDAASSDPARGLAAVRALRTLADRLEDVQVANARANGWSWQSIAEILQISRQAVHQKHAHREARESGSEGDKNNV